MPVDRREYHRLYMAKRRKEKRMASQEVTNVDTRAAVKLMEKVNNSEPITSTPVNSEPEGLMNSVNSLAPNEPITEIEVDYDDYQQYLKWRDTENDIKKKVDSGAGFQILKAVGMAAIPAIIGVIQRAYVTTIQQQQTSAPSINSFEKPETVPMGLSHAFRSQPPLTV